MNQLKCLLFVGCMLAFGACSDSNPYDIFGTQNYGYRLTNQKTYASDGTLLMEMSASYDESGRLSQSTTNTYAGAIQIQTRNTYTYTGENLIKCQTETYDAGTSSWAITAEVNLVLNEGRLISEEFYETDGVSQTVERSGRATYSYNGPALTAWSYEGYNSGSFSNDQKAVAVYDDGDLLDKIESQYWGNGMWNNSERVQFNHDDQTRIEETITSLWDEPADEWQTDSRELYVYDNSNQVVAIEYYSIDSTGNWSATGKTDNYTYDGDGRLIEFNSDLMRVVYTYDDGSGNGYLLFMDILNKLKRLPGPVKSDDIQPEFQPLWERSPIHHLGM
jgi:nuclear transport factor 2 (NTF2) superfamily protein